MPRRQRAGEHQSRRVTVSHTTLVHIASDTAARRALSVTLRVAELPEFARLYFTDRPLRCAALLEGNSAQTCATLKGSCPVVGGCSLRGMPATRCRHDTCRLLAVEASAGCLPLDAAAIHAGRCRRRREPAGGAAGPLLVDGERLPRLQGTRGEVSSTYRCNPLSA